MRNSYLLPVAALLAAAGLYAATRDPGEEPEVRAEAGTAAGSAEVEGPAPPRAGESQPVELPLESPPGPVVHRLRVHKQENLKNDSDWSLGYCQEVAGAMGELLQGVTDWGADVCFDAPPDTACDVSFTVVEPLETFDVSDGVITTPDHVSALGSPEPGEITVLIVEGIICCGCQETVCQLDGTGIQGCATVEGALLVTAEYLTNAEVHGQSSLPQELHARLWLHELGHALGFSYPTDLGPSIHRVDPCALMGPTVTTKRSYVDPEEAAGYAQPFVPSDVDTSLHCATLKLPQDHPDPSVDLQGAVEGLLDATYVHGIPVRVARALGPAAVPVLLSVLHDPAQVRRWRNAAITLGLIGDERAVPPLIEFVLDARDVAGPDEWPARSFAILALGHLVQATGDREALDFLLERGDPEAWPDEPPSWMLPGAGDHRHRLATQAVVALGLSGNAEALDMLTGLEGSPLGGIRPANVETLRSTIQMAIQTNQELAGLELVEYYDR